MDIPANIPRSVKPGTYNMGASMSERLYITLRRPLYPGLLPDHFLFILVIDIFLFLVFILFCFLR